MQLNKFRLSQQIKIEEQLFNQSQNGDCDENIVHFLATHPKQYREHIESIEDLKRIYP